MESGIKVFAKNGIGGRGRVLPKDQFVMYSDLRERTFASEKAASIMERAEQFLEEPLTVIPLSLFRDKFISGSRSNYEKVHHRRRDMLYYMTLAEIYEDKGRFTEKISDVAWAIMEEVSWVIPAHQRNSLMDPGTEVPEVYRESDVPGMDLYAAITSALLSFVKYYLKDKLDAISPTICKRIDHLVYLRGVRPFAIGSYWWMSSSCNWITSIAANILLATAITVDDMTLRERVVGKAISCLDDFTAKYPEDGCCAEGPFYWDGAAGSLFDCLEILYDISGGKINVYHEPLIKNMCEFITTMNIDDRYFVNFEDCHPRFPLYGDMITRMGEKLGSEELISYGRYTSVLMGSKGYFFFGSTYRSLKAALAPMVKEAPKTKGKLSSWLFGHKIAVFRECEDTSKGLFLATKGGTNGEPGNHNDVGCLVIFSNGKPVIVDPGVGTYNNNYFGETRYLRWYTNASYHSCPTVNGFEQIDGKDKASRDEVADVANRCVSMDISGAYPEEAGIISLVRSSSLENGRITVTDTVHLKEQGDVSFHFTSHQEPKGFRDGGLLLADGVVMEYDRSLTLSIEKIENRNEYEDLNIEHNWGVPCLWRITLSGRGEKITSKVTFTK